MAFKIRIEPETFQDIQDGIDWYNNKQKGLGRKFLTEVKSSFSKLKVNPFFQIRYDNVRCYPMPKFPFMIHFTIDESAKFVLIKAIFNTSRYPKDLENRK